MLEEQAPDDLVRAAREVAAGVDDEDRDEAAVQQPRRGVRGVGPSSPIGVDIGRRRGRGSTARPAGTRSRPCDGAGCVRWPVSLDAQARSAIGGDHGRHGTEHEHERDARRTARAPNAPIAGPSSSPPIWPRRTGRRPRRAAPAASRRSGSRAPPGRRSPSPRPATARRTTNASGPVRNSGRTLKTPVASRPRTISGTRAVRSASQPKIGSPTSRAAGQAAMTTPSSREVDALLGEVERQDRQQRPEPEPHDELGEQQRHDVAPPLEPGGDAAERRASRSVNGGEA